MITKKAKIHYFTLTDEMRKEEKLQWFSENKFQNIPFEQITPDKNNNWITSDNDFNNLLSVINKSTKSGNNDSSIFKLFSSGIVTNKDEWFYDINETTLKNKVHFYLSIYNEESRKYKNTDWKKLKDIVNNSIKWTRAVFQHASKGSEINFSEKSFVDCHYRPFYKTKLFFSKELNETQYQMPQIFGKEGSNQNKMICYACNEQTPFLLVAISTLCDLNFCARGSFCFSLYRYDTKNNRIDNITDWGLEQFKNNYELGITNELKKGKNVIRNSQFVITKEDIFHYVYGVLHNPVYRKKYELNLKREFPRIPFYNDFWKWVAWGKELMDLHINYETVEPYELKVMSEEFLKKGKKEVAFSEDFIPKAKLKADKISGEIIIDELTTIKGIPKEAWEYKLGIRSAIEWVLDQYKESTPSDLTIKEKFNTYKFADYKDHVIDLLKRVVTVSVKTMEIVKQMETEESTLQP